MNANRYILIILFIILPVLATAQRIGGGKYKVSTGDTTKIVSRVNAGLNGPEFEFLFSAKGEVIDSLYNEIQPNLTSSKAVRDVNNILKEIERDQAILKAGNASLSYRLSTEYIAANKKEKTARAYVDSLLLEKKKMSESQLISEYLMYRDKPSYFVNGIPVNPEIANKLLPGDVITQERKAVSANPNGEVWLVLTEKAMRRLKLPTEGMYDGFEDRASGNDLKVIGNKEEPSQPIIKNIPQEAPTRQKENSVQEQPQEKRRTVVRSRTVNNEPVEVKNN